jgi:hypothetical protein
MHVWMCAECDGRDSAMVDMLSSVLPEWVVEHEHCVDPEELADPGVTPDTGAPDVALFTVTSQSCDAVMPRFHV